MKTELLYDYLVKELKRFFDDTGFKKAVIGLSGGIDSALVACLATDALGPENVLGITMPSVHSSLDNIEDAGKLAINLGIQFENIPINLIADKYDEIFKAYARPEYNEKGKDLTEQNLQARIRANILMAFSNKLNMLVLNTCNLTEDLLGYATLYGDAIGAISPLGQVGKMKVFELAEFRNTRGYVIPKSIIEKAPTAELESGQTDEEDLGAPYSILDPLAFYLDKWGNDGVSVDVMRRRIPGLEKYTDSFIQKIYKRIQASKFKMEQCPKAIEIN